MRKIVYYVASTLDGFIAAPDGSADKFIHEDSIVEYYQQDLANFDTTIMGRNTYEFGYRFGLKPGQRAYPHMRHYIFSNSLEFDDAENEVQVFDLDVKQIKKIKEEKGSDIYLCGGGIFAGWLLDFELIDTLKIKLNPLLLGEGIRLFGPSLKSVYLNLKESLDFENGFKILTYEINY